MATPRLNDVIWRAREDADDAALQLRSIAGAMSRLSMRDLADELFEIADRIVVGPREISEAYTVHLDEQVSHSEAMMGNLLKATLAGCIVPPKKREVS